MAGLIETPGVLSITMEGSSNGNTATAVITQLIPKQTLYLKSVSVTLNKASGTPYSTGFFYFQANFLGNQFINNVSLAPSFSTGMIPIPVVYTDGTPYSVYLDLPIAIPYDIVKQISYGFYGVNPDGTTTNMIQNIAGTLYSYLGRVSMTFSYKYSTITQ